MTQAKKAGKDVLVEFRGSDWSRNGRTLRRTLLNRPEFHALAKERFVLCSLDFPKAEKWRAEVPNPKRNEALRGEHQVDAIPTLLLFTADEALLGRYPFQTGSVDEHWERLVALQRRGYDTLAMIAKLEDGVKTSDAAGALKTAAALLSGMTTRSPGAARLAELVRQALSLRGDAHAAVRRDAVRALLRSGYGNAAIRRVGSMMDPKNEHGVLEQVVASALAEAQSLDQVAAALESAQPLLKAEIRDKVVGLFIFKNGAITYSRRLDDKERARIFARKAIDLGLDPTDRMRPLLQRIAR